MQKLSRKYSNMQFAPGLALYGIDGADGISGKSGCSLFICQYDITAVEGTKQFGTHVKQGLSMTQNANVPIGRAYINGDVFLFPNGYLYKLSDVDAVRVAAGNLTTDQFLNYTEMVGRVNVSAATDNFSESTGRLVLDTSEYKGFIINMSSSNIDDMQQIQSPLTIISDQETNNGRIYFMGLKSIYAGSSDAQLDIYFDTKNEAYVIESDKDVIINADLRVSNSNEEDSNEYDEFSRVLTTDNSVTKWSGVCSDIKWSIRKVSDNVLVPDDSTTATKKTDEIYYIGDSIDALTKKRIVQQTGKIVEKDSNEYRLWTYDVTSTQYVKVLVLRNAATFYSSEPVEVRCCFETEDGRTETQNGMLYEYRELVNSSYPQSYYFIGTELYIPRLMSGDNIKMHISASQNTYVIVYGDGVVLNEVNEAKEEEKRKEVQGDRATLEVIESTNGFYDPTSYFLTRSHYVLTLSNNASSTAETLKSATVHIAAIANSGDKKFQRAMEFFVPLHDSKQGGEDYYPKAGETSDIDLYSDYTGADDSAFIWEVSLIGNTEFFIEQKQ